MKGLTAEEVKREKEEKEGRRREGQEDGKRREKERGEE